MRMVRMNEKIYNLTVDEIMESIIGVTAPIGFSEKEIHKYEERLHITLPERYQRYLRTYGQADINQMHNHLFTPEEILTSYQCIEKEIAYMGFQNMSDEELKKYAEDEYYRLYLLPKEEWHTITKNYVLIWCENQGVWNAGYLFEDLKNGVQNPPIYMTDDDDYISFIRVYENTEDFLMEMLGQAMWGDILQGAGKIDNFLEQNGIDKIKLQKKIEIVNQDNEFYMGNCWDKNKQQFYFYYSFVNCQQLVIKSL